MSSLGYVDTRCLKVVCMFGLLDLMRIRELGEPVRKGRMSYLLTV
jgi:hypothetical protein